MKKVIITAIILCAGYLKIWACPSPGNIEGVAFTSGETLNLEILTALGEKNVNYFVDADSVIRGIRYMSHYDSRAMVFIGNYGLSYQENIRMACMGVILPLPDSVDEYAAIEKNDFDFAAAVKEELEWLYDLDVVTVSDTLISKADSALSKAGNGSFQYWTHANYILAYNSWFTYDSTLQKWSEAGADGVFSVRGVNSVKGLNGCSVISPGVAVPPSALLSTSVLSQSRLVHNHRIRSLNVLPLNTGSITVFFPQKTKEGQILTLFDYCGVVVYKKRIASGIKSLTIKGISRGLYVGRLGK